VKEFNNIHLSSPGLKNSTFLFDWYAGIRAPTWVEMDEKVLMDDLLVFLFK
jgi:hypothetical protein